jgi:intracellular multiplication protein IcmJ
MASSSTDSPLELGLLHPEALEVVGDSVAAVVHRRDSYRCHFCGLRSKKYQRVAVPRGNWRDLEAIVTACVFCQQCSSLAAVSAMRSGIMIQWLDLDQAALNRLAQELYVARIRPASAARAKRCLDALTETRAEVRERWGTDDPGVLARGLAELGPEGTRQLRAAQTEGLRLLCLDRRILREHNLEYNQFPQILAYWRSAEGPFGSAPSSRLEISERFSQQLQ